MPTATRRSSVGTWPASLALATTTTTKPPASACSVCQQTRTRTWAQRDRDRCTVGRTCVGRIGRSLESDRCTGLGTRQPPFGPGQTDRRHKRSPELLSLGPGWTWLPPCVEEDSEYLCSPRCP